MKIDSLDIKALIENILPVKASFTEDPGRPESERATSQSIEQWRLSYLKELDVNNSLNDIEKFKVFITSLLLRANRGEVGQRLYKAFNGRINDFNDLDGKTVEIVLKDAGYRFPSKGLETVLDTKKLLLDKYQGNWNGYFKEAKENYRNNFPEDDILKIKGVGFKVRDLALSCFLKEYSANDFHVVDVLVRTGLILYSYGDLNFGTNPNNNENYLFLRNLIINISEQTPYSPGEIDRIFWHFGRAICKSKPSCEKCPVKEICLTYRNKK
jgi:endonuclease III